MARDGAVIALPRGPESEPSTVARITSIFAFLDKKFSITCILSSEKPLYHPVKPNTFKIIKVFLASLH